jgi:hypothetical protein
MGLQALGTQIRNYAITMAVTWFDFKLSEKIQNHCQGPVAHTGYLEG